MSKNPVVESFISKTLNAEDKNIPSPTPSQNENEATDPNESPRDVRIVRVRRYQIKSKLRKRREEAKREMAMAIISNVSNSRNISIVKELPVEASRNIETEASIRKIDTQKEDQEIQVYKILNGDAVNQLAKDLGENLKISASTSPDMSFGGNNEDESTEAVPLESKKEEEEEEEDDEDEDDDPTNYPKPITAPDLTSEMLEENDQALVSKRSNDKLIQKFSVTVTAKEFSYMDGKNWIADSCIEFYLELIRERNEVNTNHPSIYPFRVFFFKLLYDEGYEAVKDTTSDINIFNKDILLFPVHFEDHWKLVVVDFRKKTVFCYDSMENDNDSILTKIFEYLKLELRENEKRNKARAKAKGKKGKSETSVHSSSKSLKKKFFNSEDWEIKNIDDFPRQDNLHDCGVFLLQTAEYISRDAEINFTQKHTNYFRKRMMYEILKEKILID